MSRTDLPRGPNGETYKSQGDFLKAFTNQSELIARQQKFIRENLPSQQNTPEIQEQLKRATAELAQLKQQVQQQQPAAADGGVQPQGQIQKGTEKGISAAQKRISDLRREIDEIAESDDPFSDENVKRTHKLQRAMVDGLSEITDLYARAQGDLQQTRQQFEAVENLTRAQREQDEQGRRQRAAQEALKGELSDMDSFAGVNPEFRMQRPAAEVDAEYANWAQQVSRLYYGRDPSGASETSEALRQLRMGSPSIVSACQLAGIPVEPTGDMRAYLQICELLDYRDGRRRNPATGAVEEVYAYDHRTGQKVVDRFPSGIEGLKAAYAYRKENDGVYAELIARARREGGAAAMAASQRRDLAAVEAGSEAGMGGIGDTSSVTDLMARRDAIDEEDAVMRARGGDPGLLDDYNRLTVRLGGSPVEIPGYTFNRT
jgi:hypothetical protein